MFDVACIGGIVQDIILFTDKEKIVNSHDVLAKQLFCLESGAKFYLKECYFTPGGGAANIAVGLSRLGLKATIVGRVGNDEFAKDILKQLKKQKVDLSFVQKDETQKTGFSFILSSKQTGEQIIFSFRGANNNLKVPSKGIKAKWFVVSSLSFSNWQKIFNFVLRQKKPILWNPGFVQFSSDLPIFLKFIDKVQIFVVNEDEAREIVFRTTKRKNFSIKEVLKIINSLGPNIVVITQGPKGARAFDGRNFYHCPAKKIKVVQSTGAGDAFISGFLAEYIKKACIYGALEKGIVNSGAVLSKIGAQNGLLKK